MAVLQAATIALYSYSSQHARPIPFLKLDAGFLIHGLLGLTLITGVFSLYHLRRLLQRLRADLIEQTDAATKNRVRGEQFYGLSILDPLTGLYNRRFGETRLKEEVTRAKKSDEPLLLLAIDFDRFKEINDTYGHAAGDLALKEFSRRLQRAIRSCDVPIRIGGDEFLVILPECSPEMVKVILSRMGSVVLTLNGNQIPVSFSHGMAQYQTQDTPETMIKRADERLYATKAKRKADALEQSNSVANTKSSPLSSTGAFASPLAAVTRAGFFRQSERIKKQIAVVLIGSDLEGKIFSENTNTVELSRHGSKVISRRKLAPDQEMIIRRQDTNKEAQVRVVRKIASKSHTYTYGLELVSSHSDIWGIEFPHLTESEKETLRALFECTRCKTRETLGIRKHESDAQAADRDVVRACQRCGMATAWTPVLAHEADGIPSENPQCFAPGTPVS